MSDSTATLRPLARRMVLRAALMAGTTLVTLVAAGRPVRAAGTITISIDNFAFAPAELSIAPGTTVIWTNHDDIPHTVTSTDGVFRSHALDTDDSFSFTFEQAGSHRYFCSLHPHMVGTITVG